MMEKVRDWVQKWKDQCGTIKEPDDTKLIIKVDEADIYLGHFLDVPEELYDRNVYKNAQILDSTEPNRRGAYVLYIDPEPVKTHDEYLEGLYSTVELCDLVLQNEHTFSTEQLEKARKIKRDTQVYIEKRKAIPFEKRI